VDLQVQIVGSIWRVEEEWIGLHPYPMEDWCWAGLEKPISMGQERTVNFVVETGQKGKERPVELRCRGPVSGRLVQTLTFLHSWLMGEDSRRGWGLVALEARLVGEMPGLVGSAGLVGMVRMLVWRLPL
jgi:hypothetical protein